MNAHARWRDPADDAACIAWARALSAGVKPFASGSVYVNFLPEDEADRTESAYGANYRAPRRDQAPLRPRKPLPREPEHSAGGRTESDMNQRVRVFGAEPATGPAPTECACWRSTGC